MKLIKGGRVDEPSEMRRVEVQGLDDDQLGAFVHGLLSGTSGKNVIAFPERYVETRDDL